MHRLEDRRLAPAPLLEAAAAPPSRPAAVREADATAWLLRVIVSVAAVSVGLDELVHAGPSVAHAPLGLPPWALGALAGLELTAGLAALLRASRAAVGVIAALAAALSVALLGAGSPLALQAAFVTACAVVLLRLDRLLVEELRNANGAPS